MTHFAEYCLFGGTVKVLSMENKKLEDENKRLKV